MLTRRGGCRLHREKTPAGAGERLLLHRAEPDEALRRRPIFTCQAARSPIFVNGLVSMGRLVEIRMGHWRRCFRRSSGPPHGVPDFFRHDRAAFKRVAACPARHNFAVNRGVFSIGNGAWLRGPLAADRVSLPGLWKRVTLGSRISRGSECGTWPSARWEGAEAPLVPLRGSLVPEAWDKPGLACVVPGRSARLEALGALQKALIKGGYDQDPARGFEKRLSRRR